MKALIIQPVLIGFSAVLWTISISTMGQVTPASWQGTVHDEQGSIVAGAQVELREPSSGRTLTATTDAQGAFGFSELLAGEYTVRLRWHARTITSREPLRIRQGERLFSSLQVPAGGRWLEILTAAAGEQAQASGGEKLSSRQVSALPLNKRDFSQLLLLAAGTMTDTNGSSNFTQQFAVNGQRGSTAMFAMDGVDTNDPELTGATFTNFNVDAVQEIQSTSGVLPAEIGHGAEAFTNIQTKSGTNLIHGSVFEFVRNSALDARNFFDRRSLANPDRIPPFRRNEFGFGLGGPVTLPGIYRGRDRTFFFSEYQGFRQVLGTTQILSVPTQAERQGVDTTAFRSDTLHVPVNPQVTPILAAYPEPNDPLGPYGARTFATSSKVATDSNQFSARIDHRISDAGQLFVRFSLDNTDGPLTNPNQTAIQPSFAINFHDHQRNAALNYTRTISPRFTSETSLGFIRSTPLFIPANHTQPGMKFADGLYEPFNSTAGTVSGNYGDVYQLRQNFIYLHGAHTLKFGLDMRFNDDSAVWGISTNGTYTFGGGTAYAPVGISSASGMHNIQVGDPLPDSLTGFLTATPFAYDITAATPYAATGDRFNEGNVRRKAIEFYFQDAWKVTPRLTVNYGLRYDLNGHIYEGADRTSKAEIVGPNGQPVPFWQPGARQIYLLNPQPLYDQDLRGWGPRLSVAWQGPKQTVFRAGGGITTILPNIWLDNSITGTFPFVVSPTLAALPGAPLPFHNAVVPLQLPSIYTTSGQLAVPTGNTRDVPHNTVLDVARFQADLSALTPGHQPQPLGAGGLVMDFRNGYIGNYMAGFEHTFKEVVVKASYVATVGVHLANPAIPNGYTGASPQFAPFTAFDASGQITGGYASEHLMATPSHSTYHSLQLSASKSSARWGLGFESSYTLGKALDDTSTVGSSANLGTILQASYQNPWNPGADKGPSTFDIRQAFTVSAIQALPFDRVSLPRPLGTKLTSGWQILNITTLTSGSPFSVYSGIQQTGMGSGGADRPDQVAAAVFSTRRAVREDYFGRGADNPSFFSIPIGVPGGTGPNQGRFGTLGRDTFRGPAYYNFDLALIKETSFGKRSGSEPVTLEFRAEVFNAFNLVTFALPVNVMQGSGFGLINHTAGTSRQIQFSLKLIF